MQDASAKWFYWIVLTIIHGNRFFGSHRMIKFAYNSSKICLGKFCENSLQLIVPVLRISEVQSKNLRNTGTIARIFQFTKKECPKSQNAVK